MLTGYGVSPSLSVEDIYGAGASQLGLKPVTPSTDQKVAPAGIGMNGGNGLMVFVGIILALALIRLIQELGPKG